jgi:hypothetical protein
MRTLKIGRVLALASALGIAFGCNAILGIDEPKLVEGVGSGGKGSGGEGSGGEGSGGDTETGGTDGGGNATGSGGASSGGKSGSGGGKASGGTSSGGTTGSGGTATGGTVATGGTTDAGPQAPSGVPGQVACGTESCRISGGSGCCVQTTSGDDPHCAASCDSASQTRYNCDGAEDCSSASAPVCCLALGATTAQCAATCTGRVICGADADCSPGQYCAPGTGAFEVVSLCTRAPTKDFVWCGGTLCDRAGGKACCFDKNTNTATCTATCPGDDIKYQCDDATDCANGMQCCETRTGLGVLTGSSCQASCAAGAIAVGCGAAGNCPNQICCHVGGGSACSVQCATEVLCGTDADCGGPNQCELITATLQTSPTGKTACKTNVGTD